MQSSYTLFLRYFSVSKLSSFISVFTAADCSQDKCELSAGVSVFACVFANNVFIFISMLICFMLNTKFLSTVDFLHASLTIYLHGSFHFLFQKYCSTI